MPKNTISGYDVVEKLLDSIGDADVMVSMTTMSILIVETSLLFAIKYGTIEVVDLLVKRGADVNREPKFTLKQTPLQKAAELGDLEMVKYLLDHGADVNGPAAMASGATALQFAAISGNCNVAAELLDRGARLDTPPSRAHGRWPLEGAAEHGRLDMIKFLFDYSLSGFPEKQCQRAMKLAEHNGHFVCRNLIRELMSQCIEPADPAGW
ncbi:hypothetical protein SLS62_010153 [Diatrype stigma]|uniref:Uncharacterized protein n=1 Tax=Diatrype stigma TaxID=117547 RepID=A0AAN9UA03_9PEZI